MRRKIYTPPIINVILSIFMVSVVLGPRTVHAEKKGLGRTEKIVWMKDGQKKRLKVYDIELQDHFRLKQLAKLSGAQLRWKAVSDEACLTRVGKTLCFNWNKNDIYLNGKSIGDEYKLRHQANDLFVPFKFVISKSFQIFSETNITWDAKQEQLVQKSPVNLKIPAVENKGDRYRLGLAISPEVQYKLLQQSKKKVWLRFMLARTSGSSILEGDSVIKEVRVQQKKRSADLILKLGKDGKSSHVFFDPKSKKLVVDIFTSDLAAKKNRVKTKKKVVAAPVRKKRTPRRLKPVADKSIRTIVIDPGHGGIDAGAIGLRGTREKDINLKVSKALAKMLRKEPNTRVILTRDTDVFIPLGERTKMANDAKADLFVSIHCNSSLSKKSTGFEVYVLALEATDKAAAAVARLENSVVRLETKSKKGTDKLTSLLASMAINDFVNESSECSGHICRGVKNSAAAKKTAVKRADFFVLRGAQMPAVLVELGYLSNSVSELKLRSARHRSKLVKGIHKGIVEYDQRQRAEIRRRPKSNGEIVKSKK